MESQPSQRSLIRVLIVARSAIVRAGLESLLATNPVLQVIGLVASLSTPPLQPPPDVVLLESDLDDDLTALLAADLELQPSAVVLLLDDWQPASIANLLRLGVQAVLPTEATAEEIWSRDRGGRDRANGAASRSSGESAAWASSFCNGTYPGADGS